ncbi:MAG: hypothetical protein IM638_16145 [Bacteroidetes bacterium]|nr:hypothetical protein [Bacteroidota bacterium]
MKSIDIQTKEHSAGTLGIVLNFDEELTPDFAEFLGREVSERVRPAYSGLLIETGDTLFLTIDNVVVQNLIHQLALQQFTRGVAVVSQSRITRQLLSGVLLRSITPVPIRVFSDTISAFDWLENRTLLFQ